MKRELDWANISFLSLLHVGAIWGFVSIVTGEVHPGTLLWQGLLYLCGQLCISAGYHRLFSHNSHKARRPLKILYGQGGAISGQSSVLFWASTHRRHHAYPDTDMDPYNARKGFFHCHLGWMLRVVPKDYSNVRDLQADPNLTFQDKHFRTLFFGWVIVASVVPLLWGDANGLEANLFRLAVQLHAICTINSVAHETGPKRLSLASTAKNSVVAALVSMGEGGGHAYHHAHERDYRNGPKWYHYDPTKWLIWLQSKVGLAWDLRREIVPRHGWRS